MIEVILNFTNQVILDVILIQKSLKSCINLGNGSCKENAGFICCIDLSYTYKGYPAPN